MSKTTIEEALKKNGFHLSTIVGDSMMPLLKQGRDLVKVVPNSGDLKKYDVALFKRPETGAYVLHRVVKVMDKSYLICGDNRFYKEEVPKEWIIGVADGFIIDGEEVAIDNPKYVNYYKMIEKTFLKRKIKYYIFRLKRKIKK